MGPVTRHLAITLTLLSLLSTEARAEDYHVAAGAAGTGTAADPFGTIAEGLDAAQPGDAYLFKYDTGAPFALQPAP